METDIIFAIDCDHYNNIACWYDPCIPVAEFRTIRTMPDGFRPVLSCEPVSSVVFEDCSQAGCIHDLCAARLSAQPPDANG